MSFRDLRMTDVYGIAIPSLKLKNKEERSNCGSSAEIVLEQTREFIRK
jgi:hypothetical protein